MACIYGVGRRTNRAWISDKQIPMHLRNEAGECGSTHGWFENGVEKKRDVDDPEKAYGPSIQATTG